MLIYELGSGVGEPNKGLKVYGGVIRNNLLGFKVNLVGVVGK